MPEAGTFSFRRGGSSIWLGFAIALVTGQVSLVYAQVPAPGNVGPPHSRVAPPVGVKFPTSPQPGFHPLTASDSELNVLGFPPKPDAGKNPRAYAHWSKMVTAAKTRISPVLQQTNIFHTPAQNVGRTEAAPKPDGTPSPSYTVVTTSSNWSGWVDYQPNAPFLGYDSFVFGEWVIPFAQQAFGTCSGGWEYSGQWVGFDGFNSIDILQAGSEADAYCNGSTNQQSYAVWYEWYPNAATRIANLTINPGDLLGVEVWYTSGAAGAYFINYTTQVSTSIGFFPPTGTSLQGTSVEWIVEAPIVNGGLAALINYTAVPWNYAYAYSTTTQLFYEPNYAPGGTAYDIEMTANSSIISYCNWYYEYSLWCYPYGSAL